MNEEDQKIRELFAGLRSEPAKSEVDFMARLQQQMDAVDAVKDYCRAEKRRNRRAVIIAALAGILTGVGLTLGRPYFSKIPGMIIDGILPWIIIAAGVIIAIFLAFFLALHLPPATAKEMREDYSA